MKYIITESQFEDGVIHYLNEMYGDMIKYETEKYPDYIFFVKDDKVLMEYDTDVMYLLVDRKTIWKDLEYMFSLNNNEIETTIKKWVKETYNLDNKKIKITHTNTFFNFKIKEI